MNKLNSKTYCSYFWDHLCVGANARMKVCCRFEPGDLQLGTLGDGVGESFNVPVFQKLRENALNGTPNSGCIKCYKQEEASTPSLRNRVNECAESESFDSIYSEPKSIKTVEVFVGDTCNLKCLMCGPDASSQWRKDYEKLGWSLKSRSEVNLFKVAKAIQELSNLEEVKFVGGEPLLVNDHISILKSLKTRADQIELTYFTNTTVLPSKELMDAWQEFRRVNLYLSVDAVGGLNEYIRFPSRWKDVDEHVEHYINLLNTNENFKIYIFSTISVLNVWGLPDLTDWYQEKLKKVDSNRDLRLICNPVESPRFLSLENIPLKFRKGLMGTLSESVPQHSRVINWLRTQGEINQLSELEEYINSLDRLRGLSVQQVAPQIHQLFVEN